MRIAGPNALAAAASRAAAVCWLLAAGCAQNPPGELLCKDPADICECEGGSDRGAVVVRWRVSDAQVGRLLSRGECCCLPNDVPPAALAKQQCEVSGSRCPQSPAWLVRLIQLRITPVEGGGKPCVVVRPCTDAELTTQYCLAPGLYDLQVTADVDVFDESCGQFVCANRPALAPPSVRRRVVAGQTVNLDGIVLGVNAPPVSSASDGGTAGRCSAPTDGGAHE